MTTITHGIDVRTIPLSEFPTPPELWVWQIDDNHLILTIPDEEYFFVRYDVPGGYIISHAETDVVAFFIDTLRTITAPRCAQCMHFEEYENGGLCHGFAGQLSGLAMGVISMSAQSLACERFKMDNTKTIPSGPPVDVSDTPDRVGDP